MAHRILVADDDPHIRDVICFALEKAGMTTVVAKDGAEAIAKFDAEKPEFVVLDIGMPEADGLEVCRHIRKSSTVPILFLSARDEEIDRVLGLELGGDDYVTKPFSPRELVARVKVILRRTSAEPAESLAADRPRSHGRVSLDPARHEVAFDGRPINLTAIEFAILKILFARPGVIFTRDQIMTAAYTAQINVSDRTIDSHIRNIRAKFAEAGCGNPVDTVHGVGFRLGLQK
jgi:two-component system OmpR family response regulator